MWNSSRQHYRTYYTYDPMLRNALKQAIVLGLPAVRSMDPPARGAQEPVAIGCYSVDRDVSMGRGVKQCLQARLPRCLDEQPKKRRAPSHSRPTWGFRRKTGCSSLLLDGWATQIFPAGADNIQWELYGWPVTKLVTNGSKGVTGR